jgi:hypothetical protein
VGALLPGDTASLIRSGDEGRYGREYGHAPRGAGDACQPLPHEMQPGHFQPKQLAMSEAVIVTDRGPQAIGPIPGSGYRSHSGVRALSGLSHNESLTVDTEFSRSDDKRRDAGLAEAVGGEVCRSNAGWTSARATT